MSDGKSTLGAIKADRPLQLMPFPNGGWTIIQSEGPQLRGREIGAFSNAKDMLDALAIITKE